MLYALSITLDIIYNFIVFRLSRARRVIENVFGIFSAKWRIFRTTINAEVELVERITHSCVFLHNWLMQRKSNGCYFNENIVDHEVNNVLVPGSWREEENHLLPLEVTNSVRNPATAAKNLRMRFADYFVGSGAVEWQSNV